MTAPFALVLAAGASRRFGSPKALALFRGRSLLELAIERVRSVAGDRFAVVIGADADALLPALVLAPHQIIRHDAWRAGQSSSLCAGLAKAPSDAAGLLITLLDQPLVTAKELRQLLEVWASAPDRPAAAEYAEGQIGAPCVLPRHWFAAISQLQGDRGANALLRASKDVSRVPMPSAAHDVDTPDDLARLSLLDVDVTGAARR
jgi:molybdenum cofactor cytidylyltransferase